ncbi:MAG: hypothetical protein M1834_004777 [Cirrosporium novae-zelandiae]|nr:MAG: hypothetical protein M1834_004777 [Cirrosporium novae-zelandiae]
MFVKLIVLYLSLVTFATATLRSQSISELRKKSEAAKSNLLKRDVDPSTLYPTYNISVPIDHFQTESQYEPHTNDTFSLRYWFDASNYQPGGPVIVLQSGETDATERLVYLQKGLLAQLAQATNGIGVVLEHRYYGESWPTSDLSTKNLRFLTTEQALADEAYFAQNVVFAGFETYNLTAPNTAYIGYGGSYAGAFNAFLRTQYPDIFWGTISSSGVVEAIYDYWQYYEPIRVYGPSECISTTQTLTHIVDNILIGLNDTQKTQELKAAFGLENVTYDNDFANVLSGGIQGWQSRNWDPEVTDLSFSYYCGNITAHTILYPSVNTNASTSTIESLITAGGYPNASSTLTTQMQNYINWLNLTSVAPCTTSGATQDSCFSNHNATFYAQDDISQTWRSWPYQYCTEWGYLQTGSGVPASQLPLISRTIDLEYLSLICNDAFNISTPPDLSRINRYGGFNISYPRLAFIDGEADPWRPATPHASPFIAGVRNRSSTTSEPFILIEGAVHHWDENGLFANETTDVLPPKPVRDTQREEVRFVKAWMEEWGDRVAGKRHLELMV